MVFSPENLKILVNSREIHAFIQTATYPLFTKMRKTPQPPFVGCVGKIGQPFCTNLVAGWG